jgi:hypothetical protein
LHIYTPAGSRGLCHCPRLRTQKADHRKELSFQISNSITTVSKSRPHPTIACLVCSVKFPYAPYNWQKPIDNRPRHKDMAQPSTFPHLESASSSNNTDFPKPNNTPVIFQLLATLLRDDPCRITGNHRCRFLRGLYARKHRTVCRRPDASHPPYYCMRGPNNPL